MTNEKEEGRGRIEYGEIGAGGRSKAENGAERGMAEIERAEWWRAGGGGGGKNRQG